MATTSIWDKLKNIIMPSTTGPTQVADPNIAMWQGMQQMQQGQANNLAAVLKFQADQQATKDSQNQALQNQINSRPGAAWGENGGSGPLRREQLANPMLESAFSNNPVAGQAVVPQWARMSSLMTPGGMQNALAVSQVQNNPNAVVTGGERGANYTVTTPNDQNLPQGTTRAPIYQDGQNRGTGIFNRQTGALQGYGLTTPNVRGGITIPRRDTYAADTLSANYNPTELGMASQKDLRNPLDSILNPTQYNQPDSFNAFAQNNELLPNQHEFMPSATTATAYSDIPDLSQAGINQLENMRREKTYYGTQPINKMWNNFDVGRANQLLQMENEMLRQAGKPLKPLIPTAVQPPPSLWQNINDFFTQPNTYKI